MDFLDIPGLGKAHYHEYGSGSQPMLALHGYGMTGAISRARKLNSRCLIVMPYLRLIMVNTVL